MNVPQSEEPIASDLVHEESLVRLLPHIHPFALGVALGSVAAAVLFLVTAFHIVIRPDVFPTRVLKEYFVGYHRTWLGAVIGAAWMFGFTFVASCVGAGIHNLTVYLWLLVVNTRAELTRKRDVLDQLR